MTASAVAGNAKKPARSGRRSFWLVLTMVVALSAAFPPIAAVILCGMLPTVVAYVTDRDPLKHAALTVGGLNLCGAMPFAIAVWHKGHTLDIAFALLAHPVTWLLMLGGAGLGWMIYFSVPPAVSAIVVRRAQAKMSDLEDRKKKLAELWDPPLGAATPQSAAPAKAK